MKERTSVPTSMLGIANKARVIQVSTLVLLRKRVFTKSPVRENRTPGSVRGLSGNWQSYRAQLFIEATDGNAQFLSKVARSALVPQAIHIPHRVAIPLAIAQSGQSSVRQESLVFLIGCKSQ